MSTHIVGFKPADEKYRKMKAALDACKAAGVDPPAEVKAFFGDNWDERVDDHGVRIRLNLDMSYGNSNEAAPGVTRWKDDMNEGYEVDLRKLDPDIKILRFYNSW